jgi:hypothetical protein
MRSGKDKKDRTLEEFVSPKETSSHPLRRCTLQRASGRREKWHAQASGTSLSFQLHRTLVCDESHGLP